MILAVIAALLFLAAKLDREAPPAVAVDLSLANAS